MNLVLEEANERIKFPLRKVFINLLHPSVSARVARGAPQRQHDARSCCCHVCAAVVQRDTRAQPAGPGASIVPANTLMQPLAPS
jgi:hypothetical protein